MTTQQFYSLLQIAKLKESTKSVQGARLVLVEDMRQTKAAEVIGISQSAISQVVGKLKNIERLINRIR